MKKKTSVIVLLMFVAFTAFPAFSQAQMLASKGNDSGVMTKDSQAKLTPDAVLEDLMEGNKRFTANRPDKIDMPAQVKATSKGQYPKAVILSCIDSRVPVEMLFDQGIGDVFVARVAGNTEDESILGSMEYATAVAGSKLVMVLGHEACGAVKSAIDEFEAGDNVAHLLGTIEPAIDKVKGDRDSSNKEYVEEVVKVNVQTTIDDIRERSPIIAGLEKEGKIKIVGAYYDLHTGAVSLVD